LEAREKRQILDRLLGAASSSRDLNPPSAHEIRQWLLRLNNLQIRSNCFLHILLKRRQIRSLTVASRQLHDLPNQPLTFRVAFNDDSIRSLHDPLSLYKLSPFVSR